MSVFIPKAVELIAAVLNLVQCNYYVQKIQMCNKLWYVRMFGTFQSPYLGVIYYIIFPSWQFSMYTNISSSTIMFVESGVRSRHSHLQKGFLPSHFDVV